MKNKLKNSTVAITGGCGFIGSHLIDKLLVLDVKKIIVIDSLEYGKIENISKSNKIEFIKFNLGTDDKKIIEEKLSGVDYLFHLAAEKHNQSKNKPIKVQEANILGMYDLLEAAVLNKIKKVVFSSSLYAYGRISTPKFKESDILVPQTIYGMTKIAGENLLRFFKKNNSLDYVALRLMFVYGPRQYAGLGYKSVIVSNFTKIINNESPTIYGDGNQTLDYIYVEDVVDVMIKAMISNISDEIFNVGSSNSTSINKLTKIMLSVTNSKLEAKFLPKDWTHGSIRVANISKIKKALNFKPKVNLIDGLTKTYNWLLENKKQDKVN